MSASYLVAELTQRKAFALQHTAKTSSSKLRRGKTSDRDQAYIASLQKVRFLNINILSTSG